MPSACQGKHAFSGPKRLALLRLTQRAEAQGQVVLVVMPVSPIYQKEFLQPRVLREFEAALADLQWRRPQVQIVRLDQLPKLNESQLFSDLVHINMYGQEIATKAFLNELKKKYCLALYPTPSKQP